MNDTSSGHQLSPKMIRALIRFHKSLENRPTQAVSWYKGIVDYCRENDDITVVEDCAQVLAEYIKKSSLWKQRAMVETLQKLAFPKKVFIVKHFADFNSAGISVDYLLSCPVSFNEIAVFQKSKRMTSSMVFGENSFGKLGVCEERVRELTPFDFDFKLGFHGKNHTIFWRKFTGELWACGKADNFLVDPLVTPEYYSSPVKLDYINLKTEKPIIEVGENYTKFVNYTNEKTLFVGNSEERQRLKDCEELRELEEDNNWMITRGNSTINRPKVQCQRAIRWEHCECRSTVWYRDRETLFRGRLHFAVDSEDVQLVASLNEVPFPFKTTNPKNAHIEELHPRHQMDYSVFTLLTFHPWAEYLDGIETSVKKLDAVEQFLNDQYQKCFNEYGMIIDELETLTAIDHLYQLIRVGPGQKLPGLLVELAEYGNDKFAQLLVAERFCRDVKKSEDLRIMIKGDKEQIAREAQLKYEHKISVIRSGLQLVQTLGLPSDHEGIWTYTKYADFIGYFKERHKLSKGRFETKLNMTACFQTRDIGRIIERRNIGTEVIGELVKVQAVGHRSDKTKMNHFYIYPCIFYVLRTLVVSMDLIKYVDENNVIDLNSACDQDVDNTRFVGYIEDLSGCEHPKDFKSNSPRRHRPIVSGSVFNSSIGSYRPSSKTAIPYFLHSFFDEKLKELKFPNVSGAVLEMAMESLVDMREMLSACTDTKYKVYVFYCETYFLEAAADVMKLIVLTGNEEDVHVFHRLFSFHPEEMVNNVAKYRPEMLFLWQTLPLPAPPIPFIEKIYRVILRKRYSKSESQKPLIMIEGPVMGSRTTENWLRGFFTNREEDVEKDIEAHFKKYLQE
ncbi:unnamed protein product [Caenorhabditis sp. 36 PRJEB53466]|nr:unnamed protein product [Caenorhabditis sp. 36 PRJEB53466]